jgi:hypothetical protein
MHDSTQKFVAKANNAQRGIGREHLRTERETEGECEEDIK